MPPTRLLHPLLGSLCLLRLLTIGLVELSPDESYYTMWSRYLDVSFYSKGPGVALAIWVSTHLFGVTEFGVRFFAPLLALGTSYLMWGFARRLYGEVVAFWAVLLLQVIPIYQVGGVLMTIDPLSVFFWMAALVTFWRALEAEYTGLNQWWIATGALIGAGFLCKWINALQIVSIILLLAITPRHRRELKRAGFWAMLGVFVLFTLPPIIWNEQHDRITYHHLFARGGFDHETGFNPGEFLQYLGAHFGVYSPLIFAGLLVALGVGLSRARIHFKPRFLLAFALPVLALYFGLAFREAGEANWTAPGTLSLGLLAVAIFYEWAEQGPKFVRPLCLSALGLGGAMSLLILDTDLVRAVGIPWPYELDPSARLRGWKTSAETIENFRAQYEQRTGRQVFLIANKYQTAASLAFYLKTPRLAAPGHPPVYIPESQAIENQFSFWPRYDEMEDLADIGRDFLAHPAGAETLQEPVSAALDSLAAAEKKADPRDIADARRKLVQLLQRARPQLPLDESFVEEQGVSIFAGHDALYVTDRAEDRAPSSIKDGFEKVELIACLDLDRVGKTLRQWRIFACTNYHGMSL